MKVFSASQVNTPNGQYISVIKSISNFVSLNSSVNIAERNTDESNIARSLLPFKDQVLGIFWMRANLRCAKANLIV